MGVSGKEMWFAAHAYFEEKYYILKKKYVHLFKENQNPNNPYYEIFLWEPSESDLSCSLTLEWTLEPHVYP